MQKNEKNKKLSKIKTPHSEEARIVFGLGIDYNTSQRLFPAVSNTEFIAGFKERSEVALLFQMLKGKKEKTHERGFRSLLVAQPTPDLNKPRKAGWTYLYNDKDPQIKENHGILKKLAMHRLKKNTDLPAIGEKDTDLTKPLIYKRQEQSEWLDWLKNDYLLREKRPKYILIIGGPEWVPFGLQSLLSSIGCYVGRLSFDTPGDYNSYINKVLELEDPELEATLKKETFFFAPDHGEKDPTHYCRINLVDPLIYFINDKYGKKSAYGLKGDSATQKAFLSSSTQKSALVFITAHGLANTRNIKEDNGAIFCPEGGTVDATPENLFSAMNVPESKEKVVFYHGSAFFNFGCFSYGTPKSSDLSPIVTGKRKKYHQYGFVAALPKKLLAHSLGPIAYIGHLDTAYLNGFITPKTPKELLSMKEFIGSYTAAVDSLLSTEPVGRALRAMNKESVLYGEDALNIYDDWNANAEGLLRFLLIKEPSVERQFIESWIRRNNTRNFMLLGDPGARLSIRKED